MDWITQFFGRLHPLVVHFPIGILFVAFFFECLSQLKPYKRLRAAVQPALLIGLLCSIVSVVTGLYLSDEGGYDDDLLQRHKLLGIATAVMCALVYAFRKLSRKYFGDKSKRHTFNLVLFFPLILLVSFTGHYGGSMTHGPDYLFAGFGDTVQSQDLALRFQAISDVDQAAFYNDVIQPILETRCYSCHSARRQKGDLRLDARDFILKGGENGPIIDPGNPDSSSLFSRLMLPLEHDDHMPPNEKAQPSSAEIALIQSWIKEGANFDIKVSGTKDHDKIKSYFVSMVEQSETEALTPEEEGKPGEANAIAELSDRGVTALPVSDGSNYLSVTFVNKRSVSSEDISLLLRLQEQIVWLDLARTDVSDENIRTIGDLRLLRRLNLEFSNVTDAGLDAIASLPDLQYLNIVGTKVTDSGLQHLSGCKNLRKVFAYQTSITPDAIRKLKKALPDLKIDTGGYQLPKLLTDSVIVEFNPR